MILLFLLTPELLWRRRSRATPSAEKFRQREKGDTWMQWCPCIYSHSTALTCTHSPTAINCLPVHTVHSLSLNSQLNEYFWPLQITFWQFSSSLKHCITSPRVPTLTPAVHTVNLQACRVWMSPLHSRFAVPGQGMHSQLGGCHTGSCQLGLALPHGSVGAFCSLLYQLDAFCILG